MEKFKIVVHEYDANLLAILFNQSGFYDKRFAKIAGDYFRRDFMCNHNGHFRWGIEYSHWLEMSKQTHKNYAEDHNLIYWVKKKTFEAGKKMVKLRVSNLKNFELKMRILK